jgi:tetratricopeptide (TPR) repeat protein
MWDHRLHYRLQEAAATAESLIALAPKTAEAYQFRGQLMEYDKNYEGAIKWYERAVEADSTFGQAVMSLGYAHSGIGDHEQAIRYMERYIRLAPDAADPRSSLADLFVRVGRYEDALTQYQASLKLKPDYWYAVREIGTVYLALGRLREAREQFHASLGLLPKNRVLDAARCIADARVNLGRRDYEAAAEGFREALRLDSLSNQAAFGLAYAEGKRGHFKDAEQVATRIREEVQRRHLEGSAVMAGVLVMESRLRMEEGALEEALALCDSALATSNPLGRGEVFRQLAEIQLRRHEYEGALAACEEALRIAPNSIENLLTLLRVYGAAGDRRMTAEIGGRLLNLWKNADPDFGALREVQAVLRTRGTEREKQNGVEGSR